VVFFDWFLGKKEPSSEKTTPAEVDFSNFNIVTDYIYKKSGITDLNKRALTASRLQNHAKEYDIYTTDTFLQTMQINESFYQDVMNIATINESFFLREKKELDWLVSFIKESTKKLNILVLPCSTGEEVYSIILLMLEQGIALDKVNIYGCDLNSQAIKSAQKGEYDRHSLHNINEITRSKYFTENENNFFEINLELKNKAIFYQENIFEIDITKKNYDIVLSRNMFIYFDDENRRKALQIIRHLLKPKGLYIKGHADSVKTADTFTNVTYGIYSKQT